MPDFYGFPFKQRGSVPDEVIQTFAQAMLNLRRKHKARFN